MTTYGQPGAPQDKQVVPSVAFFIWRLLPYQTLMRLGRLLLKLVDQFQPLVAMLLAKMFYDSLQRQPVVGYPLGRIVFLYFALGFTGITVGVLRAAVSNALGFWVQGLLRYNLLKGILARPGSRALPGSVGEAISTLDDDVDALEAMDGLPLDLLAQLITFVGGLTILLRVDVQVTLLVFVPMMVVLTLSRIGQRRLERVRAKSRKAAARFSGGLGEVLSSVQAVQVAGAEESVIEHLRYLGEVRQRSALRDWMQKEAWGALFWLSDTICVGVVYLTAAAKMRSGAFTVGDLAMFAVYLDYVKEYLVYGGSTLLRYRLAQVSANRLMALLQGRGAPVPPGLLVGYHPLSLCKTPTAIKSPIKNASDHLETLQVEGLTMHHRDSEIGINGISFTIERGTVTAIVGRIGSGKTTLLRALLGLLPIDNGKVFWNSKRVDDLAAFCVPPRVAYTPQVPVLLSDTLRENVLLGVPDNQERLSRAISGAVLESDVVLFPDGLDTRIGVRGMRLSGGQLQRAAAARMLVRESELLVMDDISSALDVETEYIFWQRMFEQVGQNTCLVVSHRRAVLERANQILVMENGRLTACGTLNELLESSAEMRWLVDT